MKFCKKYEHSLKMCSQSACKSHGISPFLRVKWCTKFDSSILGKTSLVSE